MILFRQLMIPGWSHGDISFGDRTTLHGQIIRVKSMDEYASRFKGAVGAEGQPYGNLVNLEDGSVIREGSIFRIPSWVFDPMLRAMQVSRFKASRKRKFDCTPENMKELL